MSQKDTIDRAYGHIPKEPLPYFDMSWVPTPRGVRYYLIRFVRFLTR